MNDIARDILSCFNYGDQSSFRRINGLPDDRPAWVGHVDNRSTVYIQADFLEEINESANNCNLYTAFRRENSERILVLECDNDSLNKAFSEVAADFVDPGENGEKRDELIRNPLAWWKRFIGLFGNAIVTKPLYYIVAELSTLLSLQQDKKDPDWAGPDGASQDIHTSGFNVEVKSTISRTSNNIEASSLFQFSSGNNYLFFYRLEEDPTGISINMLVDKLEETGYPRSDLDVKLKRLRLPAGASDRNKKFRILERKIYKIDENFPRITPSSFVGGEIPSGIVKIQYKVDLSVLDPVHVSVSGSDLEF